MSLSNETTSTEEQVNVEDLRPGQRNVNLQVKCASINEEREGVSRKTGEMFRVTEALVGDETGSILLTLWNDDIDKVEIDGVYLLTNVYTSIFRESLRLNIGRYGNLEKSDADTPSEVNEENNLSNQIYEQPRRQRPQYSSYRSYGNRPDRNSWRHSWSNRRRPRRY